LEQWEGKLAKGSLMCLSSNAFALFISLLSPDIIEFKDDAAIIKASSAPVIWMQTEADMWCVEKLELSPNV